MDNMEWELKVRNQAMKRGCASEQLDALKQALFMMRVVVDMLVQAAYIALQITMALFRLLVPFAGESTIAQVVAELQFWFNKLVMVMVDAMRRLADMFFNIIFSSGPLGQALKTIIQWMCRIMKVIIWAWNETGTCVCVCMCMYVYVYVFPSTSCAFICDTYDAQRASGSSRSWCQWCARSSASSPKLCTFSSSTTASWTACTRSCRICPRSSATRPSTVTTLPQRQWMLSLGHCWWPRGAGRTTALRLTPAIHLHAPPRIHAGSPPSTLARRSTSLVR